MFNHPKISTRRFIDRAVGLRGALKALDAKIDAVKLAEEQSRKQLELLNTQLASTPKQVQTIQIDDKTLLTKLFTDLKMYLNPNDISVAAHIALDGIWEKEITRAWLSVLGADDVVLDIGANFGYFGLLSGQFTNKKKAKIVLFEANPHIVPYVKKSASLNWLNEQTVIENLAVSNNNEEVTLTLLKDYAGSSSVQPFQHLDNYMHKKMQLEVEESIRVKGVTIDSYCNKNNIDKVNLIKMDIEGYEEKAYEGMRETIRRSPAVTMFIEFTKDSYENPEEFYQKMKEDFGSVYLINSNGNIIKPSKTGYADIIGASDDWVMPVFSKRSALHKELRQRI